MRSAWSLSPLVSRALRALAALAFCGVAACDGAAPGQLLVVNGETVSRAEGARLGLVGLVAQRDGVRRGFCSGTLVAANAVLTAGHCRATPRGPVRFAVFSADIFSEQETFVPILAVEPLGTSDLALAWLAASAPGEYRPAAIVARLSSAIPESAELAAFGFGRQTTSDPDSGGPLQRLWVRPANLMTGMPIFVARAPQGSGLCFGDSGGPVFLSLREPQVVGVLSNGNPNCAAGGDTFVSVPFHAASLLAKLGRGVP